MKHINFSSEENENEMHMSSHGNFSVIYVPIIFSSYMLIVLKKLIPKQAKGSWLLLMVALPLANDHQCVKIAKVKGPGVTYHHTAVGFELSNRPDQEASNALHDIIFRPFELGSSFF